MSVDFDSLHSLSVSEKLRIVEFLWDDLGESVFAIPLPAWLDREASRRQEEMRDPSVGVTHDTTWHRIANRKS
jgi:putative addiction module component (TIGR02574 family)